jgi:hypothetical protein
MAYCVGERIAPQLASGPTPKTRPFVTWTKAGTALHPTSGEAIRIIFWPSRRSRGQWNYFHQCDGTWYQPQFFGIERHVCRREFATVAAARKRGPAPAFRPDP